MQAVDICMALAVCDMLSYQLYSVGYMHMQSSWRFTACG